MEKFLAEAAKNMIALFGLTKENFIYFSVGLGPNIITKDFSLSGMSSWVKMAKAYAHLCIGINNLDEAVQQSLLKSFVDKKLFRRLALTSTDTFYTGVRKSCEAFLDLYPEEEKN